MQFYFYVFQLRKKYTISINFKLFSQSFTFFFGYENLIYQWFLEGFKVKGFACRAHNLGLENIRWGLSSG